MAKPTPTFPPEPPTMAVLFPMTSPVAVASAPPELPGLIGAAVLVAAEERSPGPRLMVRCSAPGSEPALLAHVDPHDGGHHALRDGGARFARTALDVDDRRGGHQACVPVAVESDEGRRRSYPAAEQRGQQHRDEASPPPSGG